MIDVSAPRPPARVVRVRPSRVNAVLGTTLSTDAIAGYLDPIGFATSPVGDALDVTIPSWRLDSEQEVDVVEGVGRQYGYANIAPTLPAGARQGGLNAQQRDRRRVRQVLVGAGLSEAWSTSLLAPADLERAGLDPAEAPELENPMVKEESVLRTSIRAG